MKGQVCTCFRLAAGQTEHAGYCDLASPEVKAAFEAERQKRLEEIRAQRQLALDEAIGKALNGTESDVEAIARILHAQEYWHSDPDELDSDGIPLYRRLIPKAEEIRLGGFERPLRLTITSGDKPMDLLSAPTEAEAFVRAWVDSEDRTDDLYAHAHEPEVIAQRAFEAGQRAATEEYSAILVRQSDLLTRTVNALKGEPPELTTWSHHDIPQLAVEAMAMQDALVEIAARWLQVAQRDPRLRMEHWSELSESQKDYFRNAVRTKARKEMDEL